MSRSKLQKIKELHQLPRVAEINQADFGDKLAAFIKNHTDLTLELGCGRGEYTLALAKTQPKNFFIGMDMQGERLWYGAQQAQAENLDNVLWVRIPIEKISHYFPDHSVAAIWLTFPDPYPKKRQAKRRLISPDFLKIYQKILRLGGLVHLKTDDKNLYEYSLETVRNSGGKIKKQISDIHHRSDPEPLLKILTHFEKKHLMQGRQIYFVSWQF